MGKGDESPRYDQRIHALVSKRQKEEWKEYVQGDTALYQSISQLVRTAVQRELADENPAGSDTGEIPFELQDTVMSMADTLDNIESRLSSVERRMSQLEVESNDDVLEIRGQILEALPTDEGRNRDLPKWAMTAPEVAS